MQNSRRGLDESGLEGVIGEVYESAALANEEQWRSTLQKLAETCGAEAVLLLPGQDAPFGSIWSPGADQFVEFGLRGGWYDRNPRVTRGAKVIRGSQDILTEQRLFSARELDHLPFNAEFVNRFGMRSFAGLVFAPEGASSVYLSIERRRDQGPFEPHELAALSRALPHFQRAGRLALNVGEAHAQGVLDATNALKCGAVLLDGAGRVLKVSEKAEVHLRRTGKAAPALTFSSDGTQLVAQDRVANAGLQKQIANALSVSKRRYGSAAPDAPVAVIVPRPSESDGIGEYASERGRLPLVVTACPILGAANEVFQRAKVIVTITDPEERKDPTSALLRAAFGLTDAEARVALALQRGNDISDVAMSHGVTTGTARSQLKAIFAKTGTHRQPELISLLARFALR
jgi:DNA-binding CsgD family transcriptional regulator